MGTQSSTTQQVFRQPSSVWLSALCGVVGLFLLFSLVRGWADHPRPLFGAWVVFGLALAWSVFLRPAVVLDAWGVTLRNVVRDVHIPWARVTDVTSRWSLKVFAGDRGYTAWSISSQPDRPGRGSGGFLGMSVPGRLDGVAGKDAKLSAAADPKVNAQNVARSIRVARAEYEEAVAQGLIPASPDEQVRVRWVLPVIAALLPPAVAVVVLSLG